MKWICVVALVVNLLLFAYAGYSYITVPNSEVQRVKAELEEKINRAEAASAEFWRDIEDQSARMTDDPAGEEMDLETLLQMQENEPPAQQAEAPAEREKIRTYDIDYMEEPYAAGDRTAAGVEEAKEKIRQNPLR
jgi:hypothetical protein